jgi:acyl carrier protein phosphodiesterase
MNYLAHFYLSSYDENLLIGNYIADDVKGKTYLNFPSEIQKGILLHRKIDDFTDNHETVLNSKNLIRHHQKKYTPVVMDVFYDYFLAKDWRIHSNDTLKDFTEYVYKILFKNIKHLPLKSQMRLPFMAKSNWLYNYRNSNYPKNMAEAQIMLKEKKLELQNDFNIFFPDLNSFVNRELKKGN